MLFVSLPAIEVISDGRSLLQFVLHFVRQQDLFNEVRIDFNVEHGLETLDVTVRVLQTLVLFESEGDAQLLNRPNEQIPSSGSVMQDFNSHQNRLVRR